MKSTRLQLTSQSQSQSQSSQSLQQLPREAVEDVEFVRLVYYPVVSAFVHSCLDCSSSSRERPWKTWRSTSRAPRCRQCARGGGGALKRARSEEERKSLPPRRRHQPVVEELPGALSEGQWECPRPTCSFINKTEGGVCEMCECPPVSDSDASSEENEDM
eukprot:g83349.t1